MNSTTMIDRTTDLLSDANERCNNYAKSLGHMQGTALGAVYILRMLMEDGKMDAITASGVQRVIDVLQGAHDATSKPHEFGASHKD